MQFINNEQPLFERRLCCPVCGGVNTCNNDNIITCLDCCNDSECNNEPVGSKCDRDLAVEFDEKCNALFLRGRCSIDPVELTELKLFRLKHQETLDKFIDSKRWLLLTICNFAYSSTTDDKVFSGPYNSHLTNAFRSILLSLHNVNGHLLDPMKITAAKHFISKYQDCFDTDLETSLNVVINNFIQVKNKAAITVVNLADYRSDSQPLSGLSVIEKEKKKEKSYQSIHTREMRFYKRVFILCNCNPITIFFLYVLTLAFIQVTDAVIELTFFGHVFINVFDPIQFVVCLILYLRNINALSDYLLGCGSYSEECDED